MAMASTKIRTPEEAGKSFFPFDPEAFVLSAPCRPLSICYAKVLTAFASE
jgi:hypothetical protein